LPLFEAQTDTRYEALGAYLTCIVIIAGFGPAMTLCLLWLSEKISIVGELSIDGSVPRRTLRLRKL
jgi:hypothetical protein